MSSQGNRPYRDQFRKGLQLIAESGERLAQAGIPRPVLVGGAATEFYSAGAISTGDYDLVTPYQTEVEAALMALGFERPRDGTRGLHHYEANVGVEIVGSELLDGSADPNRVLAVELVDGLIIYLIGLEDLIADRVGQYQMNESTMRDRLAQAIYLFNLLEEEVDLADLERQLAAQTLGLNVAWLRNKADEARQAE
jgi:hypothetical protein